MKHTQSHISNVNVFKNSFPAFESSPQYLESAALFYLDAVRNAATISVDQN